VSASYDHGELVPRGSRGRTPELVQLDLGLKFSQPLGWHNGRLQIRLDVFNIFNGDTEVEVTEHTQQQGGATNAAYLQSKVVLPMPPTCNHLASSGPARYA
jgi:hypothetical protein